MAHTAALYTVRVKEKYRDYQPLGDIDGAGASLLDVIADYLDDFESTSADGEKRVLTLDVDVDGDELTAMMQHGASGVAADIVNDAGAHQYHQVASDSQFLRCGCLFKLPPTQEQGWLAAHVNNGRGIKGLLEVGLYSRFRDEFPDLMLQIRPYVEAAALRAAIDAGELGKVKLIRYERPGDRADAATDRWVRAGQEGKIELDISMRGRGARLRADLVRRFLHGDDNARDEIVEFAGIRFDQAKVEVEIEGRIRTFNIDSPDSGHPMTVDLEDLAFDDDGDPTEDSLLEGLRDVLGSVD